MKKIMMISLFMSVCVSADNWPDQAQKITHRYPLIDGHVDVPYRLQEKWEDVTKATISGDFDYPRAVAGGLSAPFMSIYTPAESEGKNATELANILIDQVEAMVYRAPEKFALARNSDDVRKNFKNKKISLLLGMENGAPIAGSMENVRHFYDRGVRYITLAHSKSNHIADSSYDDVKIWKGLSPFGVQLIAEMNRIGILIDIAHVSDDAFFEVLRRSQVPVIASHSSLRHFSTMERNVSDQMLHALAKNGGVLMINFGSYFLNETARQYSNEHEKAETAFKKLHGDHPTPEKLNAFNHEYRKKFPYPFATVSDVADHIDYAVKLVGVDYIGLGSDFDGVGDSLPTGLKTVADYPNLIAELLRRGYKENDIAKIMSGNVLRVMQEAEKFAASRKK